MVFIKGKEYKNVFVDAETKRILEEISKQTGIPQTKLIRKSLELYRREVMMINEIGNKA